MHAKVEYLNLNTQSLCRQKVCEEMKGGLITLSVTDVTSRFVRCR